MKTPNFIVGTMRLGQWGAKFSTNQYEQFIDQCLELGLREFDHADIYGDYTTETEFGEVLKKRKDLRQKIRITTKCGIRMVADNQPKNSIKSYDSSAKHIVKSVDQSLKNLGTDYIDTLLLHRPDFLMNPEKIASCVKSLKEEGKIRDFGVSNFSTTQVEMLQKFIPIASHQFQFSLNHLNPLSDGILDQCQTLQIKATAWSPIGGGFLFSENETNKKSRILNKAHELSEKYNCSLDQILIAWILRHPANVTPIMGTTKILRLASALEAKKVSLSSEDWYVLYKASTGEEIA